MHIDKIMTTNKAKYLIKLLLDKGIVFASGLTDNEIFQIETKFNFTFPLDLKLFLQISIPISDNFVNWRLSLTSTEEFEKTLSRLNWPLEGILFDVQFNDFWTDSWGTKPKDNESKFLIVKKHYALYPKLIPIYSHRYIPAEPNKQGNPIFSIYQTDIVYYGFDLASYFSNEFNFKLPSSFEILTKPKRIIKFWNDCTNSEL